ncbi:MAG: acetylglutamate kinase [Planctomycetes bacterium]|nr:acetylglutamate kinase [Planctomycetota bacterium]
MKIGGAQLERPEPRARLCAAIAAARAHGDQVVVVHGGGNQIRELGEALGLQDRYHEGLRITDAATARAALMVLGGAVNRTLVQALQTAGVAAAGLTGADGKTFTAKQLVREGVDLGYVGEVDRVDGKLVEALLQASITPVLGTVAPRADAPADEPFFNINADHAAGPLCRALRCDALLFLTDVPGVLDADGRLMPLLTDADCERLVATGVARGGMLPKLDAARRAARENPRAIVKIAPADADGCVRGGLRDGVGTRFFGQTNGRELQHG